LGAAIFHDTFWASSEEVPEELLWILGEQGAITELCRMQRCLSQRFSFDTFVGRSVLLFNATDTGKWARLAWTQRRSEY
jgi:hypothetical protein